MNLISMALLSGLRLSQFEPSHDAGQPCGLRLQAFGGGGTLFDQRGVLLRHTFEVVDRAVDLADAAALLGRINSIHEVWHHEQLQARGRWTQVDSPVGKIPALLPPGVPSIDHAKMQAVPDVGEHTEAILNELEYDADGIHALREAGAI